MPMKHVRRPRWWRDTRGVSDYIDLVYTLPLLLGAFVAGSMVVTTVSAQGVLHSAAAMADRSLVANGCLTSGTVQGIESTLQAAHMSPSDLAVQTQGVSGAQAAFYGTSGIGVSMTYHLPLTLPGTPVTVFTPTLTAQVSQDQSQAVPYGGGAACASSALVASSFPGAGASGSGTSGSDTLPAVATSVTVSATPNPATVGSPVTVTGTVSSNGTPMANVGLQVTLGSQTVTVTTNGAGSYQTSLTPTQAGNDTVTATAGPASQSVALTVNAASPASLSLTAPNTITVGQSLTVQGTVTTANGNPVADGTQVTVSSSDPAIAMQTATTQNGTFSVSEPAVTSLNPNPITITATAGSATQSATITVDPGAPQTVSLTASPTSAAAGSSWTISGTVNGPDGTPVAAGTSVTVQAQGDTVDAPVTLSTDNQGHFSGSMTLTQAGTLTLTAAVGSVTSSGVSVTVTPSGSAAVANLAASPNPVNQGATTMITGQVLDAYGNPVASGTSITLSSSAWATPVTTTTGTNGSMHVPVSFNTSGDQIVTAAAGSTALANGTVSVRVNALGAYTLQAKQSSTSMVAGAAQSVTWTLTDSQGNPVSGDTLDFSAQPASGATLSETSATTDSNGQVTMTAFTTQAGVFTVTATLVQDSGNTTGTATWDVSPAPPAAVDPPTISPSTAVSTQQGGTTYPIVTGLAVDAYGNPIAGAQVSVSGGWDPGVVATGTTNSQGYFSITLNPVDVGGPYDPTITVTSSQGSSTQTYTNTSLTVTTQTSILPPGTPMNYSVTLTGSLGNYSSSWYGTANVQLTATASQTVSGTPWFIGIYDETTGMWLSSYNAYPSTPATGDSGTTFTVDVASPFNSSGQTDTYVAAVGIMKPGLTWQQSAVIAQSAPLTLTLPTLQWSYTGYYPNIYGSMPYTGWAIAYDSATMITFQNAAEGATSTENIPINITNISDATSRGIAPAGSSTPYSMFYDSYNMEPITVQWVYNIPGAPTTTQTSTIPTPSYTPWSFGGFSNSQYGVMGYANVYGPGLSTLNMTLNYGSLYTMSLNGGSASSLNGYDWLSYLGGTYFQNSYYQDLIPPSGTTVNGSAILTGNTGYQITFACSITFGSNGAVSSGSCSQTGTS